MPELLRHCAYCGRAGFPDGDHETCEGCSAPLAAPQIQPVSTMYDLLEITEMYDLLEITDPLRYIMFGPENSRRPR